MARRRGLTPLDAQLRIEWDGRRDPGWDLKGSTVCDEPQSTMTTTARPDLSAHTRATRLPFEELASELRDTLGAKLLAYIGGVGETRAVRQWAVGDRTPSERVQDRLRLVYQVAVTIAENDSPKVAQAWMQGLNPQLDDRSPARLLRDGDLEQVGPEVVGAMRAFLVGG